MRGRAGPAASCSSRATLRANSSMIAQGFSGMGSRFFDPVRPAQGRQRTKGVLLETRIRMATGANRGFGGDVVG